MSHPSLLPETLKAFDVGLPPSLANAPPDRFQRIAVILYKAYHKLAEEGQQAPAYKALAVRTGKSIASLCQAAYLLRTRFTINLVFAHHEQRTRTRVLEEQLQALVEEARGRNRMLTYKEVGAALDVTMIDIVRAKYHLCTKRGVDIPLQRDTSKDFTPETARTARRLGIDAGRKLHKRAVTASNASGRAAELELIERHISKNGVNAVKPGHALGVVRSASLNRTI